QQLIHRFLTIRSVRVTHDVSCRKTDCENIGTGVFPELMRLHRLECNFQSHVVGKRCTPQVVVEQTLRRIAPNGVWKYGVLAIPLAIDPVGSCVSLIKSRVWK